MIQTLLRKYHFLGDEQASHNYWEVFSLKSFWDIVKSENISLVKDYDFRSLRLFNFWIAVGS